MTIRGQGASSVLAGSIAIETEGNVEIRGLAIQSPSGAAILARGGTLVVEDVDISSALGVGIALEDVTSELRNVSIEGSVDVSNPPVLPIGFGLSDASTHGLAAFGGTTIAMNVEISGTAAAGALFAGGTVVWTEGRVFDSLGVGVLPEGGMTVLTAIEIDGIVQGFELAPAYGA